MIYYRACNDSKYTVCNELYTPRELKHKFPVTGKAIDNAEEVIGIVIKSQYAPEHQARVVFERVHISPVKTFSCFGCRFEQRPEYPD